MYKILKEYVNPNLYRQKHSTYYVNIVNNRVSMNLAKDLADASEKLAYRCEAADVGRDNIGLYSYVNIHVLGRPTTPHDPKVVVNFGRMSFSPGAKVAEVYVRTGTDGSPAVRISLFDDAMPKKYPNYLMQMFGHFNPKPLSTEMAIKRIKHMLRGVGSLSVEHR